MELKERRRWLIGLFLTGIGAIISLVLPNSAILMLSYLLVGILLVFCVPVFCYGVLAFIVQAFLWKAPQNIRLLTAGAAVAITGVGIPLIYNAHQWVHFNALLKEQSPPRAVGRHETVAVIYDYTLLADRERGCDQICQSLLFSREARVVVMGYGEDSETSPIVKFTSYHVEHRKPCPYVKKSDQPVQNIDLYSHLLNGECLIAEPPDLSKVDLYIKPNGFDQAAGRSYFSAYRLDGSKVIPVYTYRHISLPRMSSFFTFGRDVRMGGDTTGVFTFGKEGTFEQNLTTGDHMRRMGFTYTDGSASR